MTTSKYPVMTLEGVKEAIREVHYNRPGVEIQAIACVANRCTYAMSGQGLSDAVRHGNVVLREGVPMPKKIVCAIGALQRQHDAAAHCIRSDADHMGAFKAAVGIV